MNASPPSHKLLREISQRKERSHETSTESHPGRQAEPVRPQDVRKRKNRETMGRRTPGRQEKERKEKEKQAEEKRKLREKEQNS